MQTAAPTPMNRSRCWPRSSRLALSRRTTSRAVALSPCPLPWSLATHGPIGARNFFAGARARLSSRVRRAYTTRRRTTTATGRDGETTRLERALDAVEDLVHDARPELHRERLARAEHGVSHGEAGRVLVHLRAGSRGRGAGGKCVCVGGRGRGRARDKRTSAVIRWGPAGGEVVPTPLSSRRDRA